MAALQRVRTWLDGPGGHVTDGRPFTRLTALAPVFVAGPLVVTLAAWIDQPVSVNPMVVAFLICTAALWFFEIEVLTGLGNITYWELSRTPLLAAALVLPLADVVAVITVAAGIGALSVGGSNSNRIRYWAVGVQQELIVMVPVTLASHQLQGSQWWLPGSVALAYGMAHLSELSVAVLELPLRPGYTAREVPRDVFHEFIFAPIALGIALTVQNHLWMLYATCATLIMAASSLGKAAQAQRFESELARTRRMLNTDPLTGLWNREHFFDHAVGVIADSRRMGTPVTIAMGDLDDFKRLNDTRGHLAGDRALAGAAQVLATVRTDGVEVGRYGGEEFILLFGFEHSLDAESRLDIALDRVRAELDELGVTISFGVATLGPDDLLAMQPGSLRRRKSHDKADGTSDLADTLMASTAALELLIERADEAMYEAKRQGKNQIVVWRNNAPPKAVEAA